MVVGWLRRSGQAVGVCSCREVDAQDPVAVQGRQHGDGDCLSLMSVEHSKLLYTFPVWALTAAKTARNRTAPKKLKEELLSSGAHLFTEERRTIEEHKREATTVAVNRRQDREATLRKWQEPRDKSGVDTEDH
ncbi:hypothetical protein ACI65C_011721 [Semiaphis heraclei]